jgi:hypothetical protein
MLNAMATTIADDGYNIVDGWGLNTDQQKYEAIHAALDEIDALRKIVRTLTERIEGTGDDADRGNVVKYLGLETCVELWNDNEALHAVEHERAAKRIAQAEADLAALRQAHARLQEELNAANERVWQVEERALHNLARGPLKDCPLCHGSGECSNSQFQCICQFHGYVCPFVSGHGDCDCRQIAALVHSDDPPDSALDPSRPTPKDGA